MLLKPIKTVLKFLSVFETHILFSTHSYNLHDTTHSQTPELHHKQILQIAANNIYRCFVNLP